MGDFTVVGEQIGCPYFTVFFLRYAKEFPFVFGYIRTFLDAGVYLVRIVHFRSKSLIYVIFG